MRSRSRALQLLGIAAAIALALLLAGQPATAAGGGGGGKPGSSQGGKGNEGPGKGGKGGGSGGGASASSTGTSSAGSSTESEEGGGFGSVNSLAVGNPICRKALQPGEERNCKTTGTPEAQFPTSNYGLEIHIETGVTKPGATFSSFLAQIANAIWTGALFLLNLVLTLLGWAFSLNPFDDSGAMGDVSDGLERFYRVFTSPWLVFAFVAIGAWGVWKGVMKREVGASIAGMVISVVLMILALVVLHQPNKTVGVAAEYTNKAAQQLIGAPLRGPSSNPEGAYAQATSETWRAMTLPGFAALNFSDVGWALEKPDPELVEYADRFACIDYAYLKDLPEEIVAGLIGAAAIDADDIEGQCEEARAAGGAAVPKARTNAELWLRNSTGSIARTQLYEEFKDDMPYAGYLSIQGEGGSWTRLPLVLVIAFGLLGGILLLAYLSIKLITLAAVAFVLLLITPLALFVPAFGERGRTSFVYWAVTLFGAIISKLIYAAILAVVLFATNVIGGLAGDGGVSTMAAFLVSSGLWWAVFLKRDELLSFISVSDNDGSSRLGRMTGVDRAMQTGGKVLGPAMGAAGLAAAAGGGAFGATRAAQSGFMARRDDRDEATRRVADSRLEETAQQRLDGQYMRAEETVQAQQARQEELRSVTERHQAATAEMERLREQGPHGQDPQAHSTHAAAIEKRREEVAELGPRRRELVTQIADAEPQVQRAGAVIAAADNHAAEHGGRWSSSQIESAKQGLRREADSPPESPAHAWRVGMTPERYQALEGREAHEAHGKVREQLREERIAHGTIGEKPAGVVGEPPPTDPKGAKSMRKEIRRSGDPETKGALKESVKTVRAARKDHERLPPYPQHELQPAPKAPRRPPRRGLTR